ncbi:MAG: type I toxin-antitoxin system SymE family toxin [Tannerellaceae bacterium]|nr:type I toxin-antitoxin system SymE family toxin [Tannerellaceae bacterium]
MPNIEKTNKKVYRGLKTPKPRPKRPSSKKVPSYPHLRKLTVSSQAVARVKSANGFKSIPFLKLTGIWLEEIGFPVDAKVDVIVDNNLLVIKPADV